MNKVIALFFVILFGYSQDAYSQPYSFTTLDFPQVPESFANGINNLGQIVGSYQDNTGEHGFLYDKGVFTTVDFTLNLPVEEPWSSKLNDINDLGKMVGTFTLKETQPRWSTGFTYDGEIYTSLQFADASDFGTNLSGINNAGIMVGTYDTGEMNAKFIYDGNMASKFLIWDVGRDSSAHDINNLGQIVGIANIEDAPFQHFQGFFYDGDNVSVFDFPEAFETSAFGINDLGSIVGKFVTEAYEEHGYIYDGQDFTQIDYPGASRTVVSGINNKGQIVGSYYNGNNWHGFKAATIAVPEPSVLALLGLSMSAVFIFRKRIS